MKMRTMAKVLAAGLSLALVGAACSKNDDTSSGSASAGGGSTGVALTGAGATFPDPIYEQWFQDFQGVESGAQINYQAIGSGGGIEQFTAQTVDFGASDAPMQTDEISALPSEAVEIPTVLGGVAVAYNVPDVDDGLKLDGTTVADIFAGKITKWNDPAIAKQNSGINLPDMDISVVHRSDESGTTFVFTSWLSAESSSWNKDVGADKSVQWPTGQGGDGNDGVAAAMTQTQGSIGYLSFDFAVKSNLQVATIKRDDGTYVAPSIESISAAGGALKFPISPTTNILNSSAKGAYPIASTTYLLIYVDQTDQAKGQTLVDFVTWALTTGQDIVTQLNYSPLPTDIASQGLQQLAKVSYQGTPIQASSTVTG